MTDKPEASSASADYKKAPDMPWEQIIECGNVHSDQDHYRKIPEAEARELWEMKKLRERFPAHASLHKTSMQEVERLHLANEQIRIERDKLREALGVAKEELIHVKNDSHILSAWKIATEALARIEEIEK